MQKASAGVALRFAFPNHHHTPAEFLQRGLVQLVASGVAVEFRQPPFAAVRRRRAVLAAFVSVPEAAVNEDSGLMLGEHDVRFARQFLSVQTKTKS